MNTEIDINMRKLFYLLSVAVLIGFTACSDDDGNGIVSIETDVDSEASIESTFEDIDNIAEAGMSELSAEGRVERDLLLDCAEVTKDTANNMITIDYGTEGCVGPYGRVRTGKIIITHDGRRFIPGAFRTITFDNFYVDSVQVEGTRSVENISANLDDAPTFRITLQNGQLSFPDGTTATRTAEWTRTWIRASNPLDDIVTVYGFASGVSREEVSYSSTVEDTDELVYKRGCQVGRVRIAVQGIKTFTYGDETVVIDYGDGECDNIVAVTRNGETQEREIDIRRKLRD